MLSGKKILVISPQAWGKMFLSKHHYALQLARYGALVYFLNPPDQDPEDGHAGIRIEQSPLHENLRIIQHRLRFPYKLRFRLPYLFHFLMRFHVAALIRAIGQPDIIWSFDLGNLYPFRLFSKPVLKIFHPVDEPLLPAAIDAAEGADIIFSVTREILDKYRRYDVPKVFINHGVAEEFLAQSSSREGAVSGLVAGVSGNFLRADIDRGIFLRIIRAHPEVTFRCWGPYRINQSNIGGSEDVETRLFIDELLAQPNVHMFGVVDPAVLAAQFAEVDVFLICYDVQKDQSRGTNYHKVMEYLATGKVIVSNNITTYRDHSNLLRMVPERDSNEGLPGLFDKTILEISHWNAQALQQERKTFAGGNTYLHQVRRIEQQLIELT